jgi:hypothetical protein
MILVGETPTFGADPLAIRESLRIARRLLSLKRNRDDLGPVLPILGPTYSGAVEPLRQATIKSREKLTAARLRFASGTAMSESQLLRLATCASDGLACASWHDAMSAPCEHRFRCEDVASFVDSTKRVNDGLFRFLDSRVGGGSTVAVLHEADTAYGEGLGGLSGGADLVLVPFPLHISQVQNAHLREGWGPADPAARLDPAARRALALVPEPPGGPIDVPPTLFPRTAAAIAERVLSNLLILLQTKAPDFVGIVGTSPSDTIFLARLVREHIPNTVLFTIGSGVLLTHPQHTRDLFGMWTVSSYSPLQIQSLSRPPGGRRTQWNQLPSSSDAGLLHATLDVICSMSPIPPAICRWSGRHGPHWTSRTGSREYEPLYLSAVGRRALALIDQQRNGETASDEPLPAGTFRLGPPPAGFATLLAIWSLFGLYVCAVYWDRRVELFNGAGGSSLEALRTISWLGRMHRDGFPAGMPACAFFLALGVAVAYPTALWGLRGQWSAATLGIACALGVSVVVIATALAVCWQEYLSGPPRTAWPALVGCCLILGSTVAGVHEFLRVNETFGALLLAQRAVDLPNGLSPVRPAWLLSAAAIALAYTGLRRRRLIGSPRALKKATAFASGLPDIAGQPVAALRRTLSYPSGGQYRLNLRGFLAVLASGSTLILLWRWRAVTIDGRVFATALTLAFPLLLGGGAYLAGSAVTVWRRLRRLLRALAWGPLSDAFDRVPHEFARTLGLRMLSAPGAASELRYDLDQASMLFTLAERQAPADRQFPFWVPVAVPYVPPFWVPGRGFWEQARRELDAELHHVASVRPWTYAYETKAQGRLSVLAKLVARGVLREQWRKEPVPAQWESDWDKPLVGQRDDRVMDLVTGYRRRPVPLLRLAEEFVAVEITRFIGYVFAHLKNLLGGAIWVVLLTMLAAGAYPFRPQHLLIQWIAAGFALLLVAATTLIIQIERNEILSRVANRTPNRIDFDATFVAQIAVYLALPVAALLITLFPALGSPLGDALSSIGTR